MQNVKLVIKRRMKELGWGPYDLAKAVKGKAAAQTIYGFVKHKRRLNTDTLAMVLDVLGLEIRVKE